MDEAAQTDTASYAVWGKEQIDAQTFTQMDNVMRLPVAIAGALLPDAHIGYGLPVGGVLATENEVIPFAVGVDIACRMHLSVYPVKPKKFKQQPDKFKNALREHTLFGAGKQWRSRERRWHAIMDDKAWQSDGFLRSLKDKAYAQLGSSGSGNHFVEWGIFEMDSPDASIDLEPGQYVALLSHSGSRGIGYSIAEHYSQIAREKHPGLPKQLKHLAWLSLDEADGKAYWHAMELAGRYAAACHEVIHQHVAKAAGLKKPALVIENHHNFAWQEEIEGKTMVIHRKGATPAGADVMGIIPGSMGDPGFVVRGKGNTASLYSAAHGAGRVMSREEARNSLTKTLRNRYLKERGVILIGGGVDESPQVYKDIETVIAGQADLVEVVGRFMPRIVRMDDK